MCLSIAIDRPDAVLNSGVHSGFQWCVTDNGIGYRCGYVRIPRGHPWHAKGYDDLYEVTDVHGGLTFAEADVHCDQGGDDDAWWIGFDCAHSGDAPDPSLRSYRPDFPVSSRDIIRSQQYVEAECARLCMQAEEATRK